MTTSPTQAEIRRALRLGDEPVAAPARKNFDAVIRWAYNAGYVDGYDRNDRESGYREFRDQLRSEPALEETGP